MSLLQALASAAQVATVSPPAAKPVRVTVTSVAELEYQAQRGVVSLAARLPALPRAQCWSPCAPNSWRTSSRA